jgi:two-component system sensor histidine kinase ChiS
VFGLAAGANGVMWSSHGEGGGASRFDPAAGNWTAYTTADGLANKSVWAIAVAPGGAVWFGTRAGVSRYIP